MRRTTIVQIVLVVIVSLALGALLLSCGKAAPQAARYQCPMHPTYITDKPGDCPICGMRLVPIEERTAPTTVPAYTCPMHPEVTSDKPGRCPKCGMNLVPTGETPTAPASQSAPRPADHPSADEAPVQGERKLLYYRNPMDPTVTSPVPAKDSMGMDYVPVYANEQASTPAGIPGRAAVEISPEGLRLAGVQTTSATRESLARTIRAVGTVAVDETRVHHVHTRISGFVEKLYVNTTGQFVNPGDPVLAIYSPQLLATQEEFLSARDSARRFAASELPEVQRGAADLLTAARRRLELFEVPASFIDELERTGKVQRTVTLDAHASGYVTAKNVIEGHQVEPGIELFTIADLSRVWVDAQVYEFEAPHVRLGQEAVVSLPFETRAALHGRVVFISPTLDQDTRTLKVRFEFPNSGMVLKPGMFANVELAVEATNGIVIPDSALIDTGARQLVFVSKGAGLFEPRDVQAGVRSGGKVEILSGVAEGEQVVIRANFLLDSESRLRAAIAGMGAGGHRHGGTK